MTLHVGRRFVGHDIEDECPCPQEPCGLVAITNFVKECEWHKLGKTIRQGHGSVDCPGGEK